MSAERPVFSLDLRFQPLRESLCTSVQLHLSRQRVTVMLHFIVLPSEIIERYQQPHCCYLDCSISQLVLTAGS